MSARRRIAEVACLAALGALLGGPLLAETTCIIADDGQSWRCGTAEELANVRPGRVRQERNNRSLPPPMLIDPSRLPRIEYDNAAAAGFAGATDNATTASTAEPPVAAARPEEAWLQSRPVAPAMPNDQDSASRNSPAPPAADSAATPAATAPVADTVPAQVAPLPSAQPTAPAPTAATITSTSTPVSAAAPPAESAAAPASALPHTPPPEPASAPVATAAAAAPPAAAPGTTAPASTVAPPLTTSPLDLQPRSLSDWSSNDYTVQLVAAASPDGFDQFARQAGLASESLFVIRLRHPDADWWLLCSGRHANLAQAQAALAQLPDAARSHGAWPRRIGPLQKDAQP